MNRFLLFSFYLVFAFSCTGQEKKNNTSAEEVIQLVSAEEFKQLIASEEVQLVDIRTKAEVDRGKINNALHIDYLKSDFPEKISKLDKDKPVALYCAVGGRSARAAEQLKALGFKKVYDLKGGINAYNH